MRVSEWPTIKNVCRYCERLNSRKSIKQIECNKKSAEICKSQAVCTYVWLYISGNRLNWGYPVNSGTSRGSANRVYLQEGEATSTGTRTKKITVQRCKSAQTRDLWEPAFPRVHGRCGVPIRTSIRTTWHKAWHTSRCHQRGVRLNVQPRGRIGR